MEPRFDRLQSQMPSLGVTPEQAEIMRDFLAGSPRESEDILPLRAAQFVFGNRRAAFSFAAGVVLTALVAMAVVWFARRRFRVRS